MKTSRFQFEYRENASKLHKAVGEILRNSDIFMSHEIYQEYPVNRVNPSYPNGSHHFDWVIPKLDLVIECHGVQHYKVTDFGGGAEKAIENYHAGKARDAAKKNAALDGGYIYVVVPFSKEKSVNVDFILAEMDLGRKELDQYNKDHEEERLLAKENKKRVAAEELAKKEKERKREARERYLSSTQHLGELKKAREFRKKQYRRLKEIKDGSR